MAEMPDPALVPEFDQSFPVPGIPHGAIPGLLGIALSRGRSSAANSSGPLWLRGAEWRAPDGAAAPPSRRPMPIPGAGTTKTEGPAEWTSPPDADIAQRRTEQPAEFVPPPVGPLEGFQGWQSPPGILPNYPIGESLSQPTGRGGFRGSDYVANPRAYGAGDESKPAPRRPLPFGSDYAASGGIGVADEPKLPPRRPMPFGSDYAASGGIGVDAGAAPPLPPPVDVPSRQISGIGDEQPPGAAMAQAPAQDEQPPAAAMAQAPAQAPAPQPDSGGFFGGRIWDGSLLARAIRGLGDFRDANRQTLLAMAGGLAGSQSWGQGIGRALQAAGPAQLQDIRLQQMNQTARALQARGLPPDVAQAAATNPALLQQLLPQLFGAKQLQHVTVKDSLGNEIPMTFDPSTGRYRDMSGRDIGSGGAQGGGLSVPGPIGAAANLPVVIDPKTGRDEQFLAALSPIDRAAVTELLEGNENAQGRNMQKYLPYAARAQPGFTQQDYLTKLATRKEYTSGPGGKEIKAVNTAIGHAYNLAGISDKLGGTNYFPSLLNPAIQGIKSAFGDVEMQDARRSWDTVSETLATEISKALNGGTPHVGDKERWRAIFSAASSPAERAAAIRSAMEVLHGRVNAASANYSQGMKSAREPLTFIDADKQKMWQELQTLGYGGREKVQQSAPVAPAPAAAAAANAAPVRVATKAEYDALPNGAHYIAPDGSARVKGQ